METTQSLDKKYRPATLDDMFVDDSMQKELDTLNSILNREAGIPGAFLLVGPSGCGKTTLARIIADMLGATGRDFKEYNISYMGGKAEAQDIIKLANIAPWGQRKVYVLNECHKASNAFQNAMLEILEEPPKDVHFVLCTTEPEKLLKTIRTRCTIVTVKQAGVQLLKELVAGVATEESVTLPDDIAQAIAEAADGSYRAALVMLDKVIDNPDDALAVVQNFSMQKEAPIELCRALINGSNWKSVASILANIDGEPEQVRRMVLGYMKSCMLKGGKVAETAFMVTTYFADNYYDTGMPGLVYSCYACINGK